MYIHSIHNEFLCDSVRVEVVYEENPVFADEEVSAIIRFRHLGPKRAPEPNRHTAEESQHVEEKSTGWGQRLSLQLSNAARSLFLEDVDENGSLHDESVHNPVELLTGYVQLSGFFTFDPQVMDQEKMDLLKKSSTVSGKIGGIDGLELTRAPNGGGLFDKVYGLFNQPIDGLYSQDEGQKKELEHMIPFFATPKSLLFGEIELQPSTTQTFYFKCRLPRVSAPTYRGKVLNINYRLIVGASFDRSLPEPKILQFPLTVVQNFDSNGYQPVCSLDSFILLPSDKLFSELFEAQSPNGRRSSFKTIKNTVLTQPKVTQSDKKDKFLKKLSHMIENPDEEVEEFTIDEFQNSNVKDNISQFTEALIIKGEIDEDRPRLIKQHGMTLENQILRFQSQYIINYDARLIASLTFSKPIYKIGECIRLVVDLSSQEFCTTGLFVSLDSVESIRDLYVAEAQDSTRFIPHYKESFTVMKYDSLTIDIPIPLNATAQFRTSIFENKWSLALKFIITKEDLQHSVHSDNSGEYFFAMDSLAGFEFNCRLPLVVLPPDQDFGGISVL